MTAPTAPSRERESPPRRDRGSAAAELAVAAPILVLLFLAVIGCGRLVETRLRLGDAAHQAARAASLARDPATATSAAHATAGAALDTGGASCAQVAVNVDTSRFRPGGSVTVTLTCTVNLADVAGVPLPAGSHTQDASFTAPVDTWRGTTTADTP